MEGINQKQLAILNNILNADYGIVLGEEHCLDFTNRILRLSILAKKHKLLRIINNSANSAQNLLIKKL